MATYTCTIEQWDDDSDVIRGFQAEVSSYGHRHGHDPDGWEVTSPIMETGESGEVVGELTYPLGEFNNSPRTLAQRKLHDQVTELLIADAVKQWGEDEPGFSDSDLPSWGRRR